MQRKKSHRKCFTVWYTAIRGETQVAQCTGTVCEWKVLPTSTNDVNKQWAVRSTYSVTTTLLSYFQTYEVTNHRPQKPLHGTPRTLYYRTHNVHAINSFWHAATYCNESLAMLRFQYHIYTRTWHVDNTTSSLASGSCSCSTMQYNSVTRLWPLKCYNKKVLRIRHKSLTKYL